MIVFSKYQLKIEGNRLEKMEAKNEEEEVETTRLRTTLSLNPGLISQSTGALSTHFISAILSL